MDGDRTGTIILISRPNYLVTLCSVDTIPRERYPKGVTEPRAGARFYPLQTEFSHDNDNLLVGVERAETCTHTRTHTCTHNTDTQTGPKLLKSMLD